MTELFEDLEELIWQWHNHHKMLAKIEKSNIEKELIHLWRTQIDDCFKEKIKAKL